jgi:prophage antirepressor-like protein
MNTQLIIKEFQTKQITIIKDDDMNVWFKGRDVANILKYTDTDQAIRNSVPQKYKKLFCDLKARVGYGIKNVHPSTTFINEAGLYKLVFRSNKKEAEEFTDWIAESVLPSIRKTGTYTMPTKECQSIELRRLQMDEAKMIGLDAKLKQAFMDRLMNDIQGGTNTIVEEKWSRDIVTIVKDEFNNNITFSEAAQIS